MSFCHRMPGKKYKALFFLIGLAAVLAPAASAQMPDNTNLRLNPEDELSPAYQESLDIREQQNLDKALKEGGSHVPFQLGRGAGEEEAQPGPDAGQRPQDDRDVNRLVMQRRDARPDESVPAPAAAEPTYEPYRSPPPPRQLRESGPQDYYGVLLERWSRPPDVVRIRYPLAEESQPRQARGQARTEPVAQAAVLPAVQAGEGFYARTKYAINSDHQGPVVLEILEEPLAGAIATGRFQATRDRLVLRIDRLEHRGRAVAVEAWAVDLGCGCYGIEGTVDSHYFERVVLPAAVRFAEGFLVAASAPLTSVFVDGDVLFEEQRRSLGDDIAAGVGAAARTAGDVLQENAPNAPDIEIPRNTDLVVMFPRGLAAGSSAETPRGPAPNG